MKLETQDKLLKRYPRFLRAPGKRLVLAGVGKTFVIDRIDTQERLDIKIDGPNEDILEDDMAPFDAWGFECSDGWLPIVDRLCRTFENKIEQMIREDDADRTRWPRIAQVKEKFGTLRFYVHVTGEMPEDLRAAIKSAEDESAVTCESCGAPGELRKSGWWHVSCDACEAERTAEKTRLHEERHEDFERRREALRAMLEARPK